MAPHLPHAPSPDRPADAPPNVERRRWLFRWRGLDYVVAIILTAGTLAGRLALTDWVGDRPMLIVFVAPIILSAYLGGLGAGLVATAAAGLGTKYLLLPPTHTLVFARSMDSALWLVLIGTGVTVSVLTEALHRAREAFDPAADGRRTSSTERKVQAGFTVALLLLLTIGTVSLLSLERLLDNTIAVRRTAEIKQSLHEVLAITTDVETAARGYTITGVAGYLEPYDEAVGRSGRELQRLRALMAADPGPPERVERLTALVNERLEDAREIISLRQQAGFDAAQARVASGGEKRLQDRIRGEVGALDQVLDNLYQERERQVESSSTIAIGVIVGGSAVACVVVVVGLVVIGRDFAGRRRAEADLRAAHEQLEARVRERTAELQRANVSLLASEDRLRTVTDTAGVGLVIVDEQHRYRYANRAYAEMLRVAPGGLVGQSVAEVLAPIYATQIKPRLDRAFRGERVTYELHRPPTGTESERFYAVAYEPAIDRSARVVVVVITDITERKQAESVLRDNESRFRQIAESLPQLVWTCRLDGACDYVSPRWPEYTGVPAEQQLGQGWLQQIHPDDRARIAAAWQSAPGSDGLQLEFRIRRHDAVYRWFDTRAVRLRDADGQHVKWFGSATDVTDRRLAEEMRVRLAAIVESSEDAIIGKTLDGTITSWNRAAERLFGYAAAEMVGGSIKRLFPRDRMDEESEIIARIMKGGSVEHFETKRLRKDGGSIDVSVTISPIRDQAGTIVGASKISRDITERKRVEEELRRHTQELRSQNHELERFNRASADRELRMIELKRQVNELCLALGRAAPYDLHFAVEVENLSG